MSAIADLRKVRGAPGALLIARRQRMGEVILKTYKSEIGVPQPRRRKIPRYRHPGNPMESNVTQLVTPTPSIQGEISNEQTLDLRDRIRAIAEDDKTYTQTQIAREAGISGTTLSQWLGGTYAGSNENVVRKLHLWLEGYEARLNAGGLPVAPQWVNTPTGEKVIAGLRYAQMANDIVVIYGGAGLGKSKSIERYRVQAPNVWVAEMTPATSGVLGCMDVICEAMGIREYSRTPSSMQRSILAKARGTNGLLVIDEAQHLTTTALDQVRAINDQAQVGLVLCGNERVYGQMAGGTRAAYLDRLFSRIGKRIHLKKSSDGDVDAIIEAWGVQDMQCKARIRDIASRPGALRVLTKVLRLAATFAKAGGRRICCDDIQAAWRELGGMD